MREYGLREEFFEVGEMGHMNLLEMNEPINIALSSADSRSLIMPYQEFRKQAPILKGTGIKKIRILAVSGMHMKMSMTTRLYFEICKHVRKTMKDYDATRTI